MEQPPTVPPNPSQPELPNSTPAPEVGQVFSPGQAAPEVPTQAPIYADRPVAVASTVQPGDQTILPQSAPTVSQSMFTPKPKRRFGKKSIVIGFAAFLLLAAGSAAAYVGYYVPNKPENMWGKSLSNMGKGYDKIADYAKNYKTSQGSKVTGSFNFSGSVATDGTIDASSDGNNGELKATVSVTGVKANLDMITVKSSTQYPDIYVKVDGLAGLDSLFGAYSPELANSIKSVNGQWYLIDHSLFAQYAGSSDVNFSKADLTEVINAASAPTKTYVLTDDPSKMAFVIKQTLGKENQDSRNVYHYKIGVNKANLKAYNSALCDSLSKTKLFKLLGSGDTTQALKDCKDTTDFDNIKDSDTADVWVDTRTKLIHKVRFADKSNKDNYFDVLQDYQGGNVLPFGMVINQKDGGGTVNASLNASLNMADNSLVLKGEFKSTGSNKESGTLNFKYAPSSSKVQIQKPANAKNIIQLANDLGFGDLTSGLDSTSGGGSIQLKAKDTERKTDIKAMQGQVEAYFAQNGYYPTLTNFNTASWRAANMKGLDAEALKDPDGTAQTLAAKPAANVYAYQALPTGCDNVKTQCTTYTLTATLSDGSAFSTQSLN